MNALCLKTSSITSPEFLWDSGPPILATFQVENSRIFRIHLSSHTSFSCSIIGKGITQEILDWMGNYSRKKSLPSLPLNFASFTSFTSQGLRAIASIPFGSTQSYRTIASCLGNPKASRAVGNVCKYNPYPLVIPCHRVVTSQGGLGGFAYGLKMKKELLLFEGINLH